MDLITHGVTGALVARAIFEGPERDAATAALTIGALFPDFDFILMLRGRYAYLTRHRGITHSFIGIPLFAPAVAGVLHWLGPPGSYLFYLGLVALGMGLHILYDLITSWGTMILAPFSDRKFYWSWISFRNVPFVLTLWISLAVSFFLDPPWSRALCAAAMVTSLITIAAAGMSQTIARRVFREALARQGITATRVEGFPVGGRIFEWSMLAESAEAFHHARVRLLSRRSLAIGSVERGPENSFIQAAMRIPAVRFYFDVTSFVQRRYENEGGVHVVSFSNARFAFARQAVRGLAPGEGALVVFDDASNVLRAAVYGIPAPAGDQAPA